MTTTDGVTLRHPNIPLADVHSRLDTDTISILSSQSDSIQHLSYLESDDEGKGLVGNHSTHIHNTITQNYQPSALKKDWIMYLNKKTSNGNSGRNHQSSSESDDSENDSSSNASENDDESERAFDEDPWTINTVQREYYTKQFRNLQSDLTKVINGHIAKEFFERSNLPTTELSQIWNLSDVNHDGSLSLAEFCTAMHLVVLRLNGFQLPDELPVQLQPYAPLIDLSEGITSTATENWATFQDTNQSPKQFTHTKPVADNHRIVAPVAVRLSPPPPPPPPTTTTKPPPPPPPPRLPGRTTSVDIPQSHPTLPPRMSYNETPQRLTHPNSTSITTTPNLYNRIRPAMASTPQTDRHLLLEQIHDLLQADHLQALSSLINTPSGINEQVDTALNDLKSRNSILKAQLKHWEERLIDLVDKRISLELQLKMQ